MRAALRLGKDRISALLLILIGLGIAAKGSTYEVGTASHMGPGFMPFVYGALIVLVGATIGIAGERPQEGEGRSHRIDPRAWACILGSALAFAIVGAYGGLAPATFVTVFVATLADRENSVRDAALLAAAMVVVATLVFSYGLGLQLPLFRWL